ncbi:MAG: hypothetical protein U0269_26045 [Polyangiales bacterium]
MLQRSASHRLGIVGSIALLASACPSREPRDRESREPRRYVTPQPDPSSMRPRERLPEPSIAQPIEPASARWIDEALLSRTQPISARPMNARGWDVYAALEPLGKLVLTRRVGQRTESAIYDLGRDRVGAGRYGQPHRLARSVGVFTTFADARPGTRGFSRTYVDVRTERAFEPRLRGPSGAMLSLHWATIDEDNGLAMAIGRDADNALYATRVRLDQPESELRAMQPVPFEPVAYAFAGAPQALDLVQHSDGASPTPRAGYECTRVRLEPDATARCVEYGQRRSDPFGGIHPTLLGSVYFDDHDPRRIVDVSTGEARATPMARATHCQTLKQLRTPPRALITCAENNERRERAYYLWSPERWLRWSEPEGLHHRMGDGAQHAEVLESFEPSLEGMSDQWIDLERGVLLRTQPLQQLRFSSHRDRTVLLQRTDRQQRVELIVLDVEQRTLQVVARFDDCPSPGYLAMDAESDGIAVFGCQVQPDPNYFRFRFRWMRAVDLRTRTLYPVRGQVAAILPAHRELLVSGALTAAAESANPLGGLTRVQLVRPEP